MTDSGKDLSDYSSTELIDELSTRSNDELVVAYRFVDDGGDSATRFYVGKNFIVNIGLCKALSMSAEKHYLDADIDLDIED